MQDDVVRKAIELVSFCGHPLVLNFHSRIWPLDFLSLYQFSSKFNHFVEVSERWEIDWIVLVSIHISRHSPPPSPFLWFFTCIQNINKMDVLFGSSFAQLQDVGKPFTRCGHTRRYLQLIMGPPPRLYNKSTETVYPLPIGGEIKQWTGRHCPVPNCHFELCLYSVGNPARTFP